MKRAPAILPVIFAMFVLLFTVSARGAPSRTDALAIPANPVPPPAPEQPLPFSHRQHVGNLKLDCRACHTNPEPGKEMTFPATSVCMSCHAAIAADKPAIQKLMEYAKSAQPIPWVRVYVLLPGVTWTHRKHLQSAVDCESCHGSVAKLPAMREMTAITSMASCISCHQSRQVSTKCDTCHAWPKLEKSSSQ